MSAWDLAEALLRCLRDRPELVITYSDGEDGIDYLDFENELIRVFEVRIQEALRMGGVRP